MSRPGLRVVLAVWLLLGGCKLLELRRNLETLDQMSLIGGHITHTDAQGAPIIVVLVSGDGSAVLDEYVLAGPGAFYFSPLPGRYRVAAFEDRNRDFVYQPAEEPAAWYGAPDPIDTTTGSTVR